MDPTDLIASGIAWCNTEDSDAGWQLIDGLHSCDPTLSAAAEAMLVRAGWPSIGLVERALALGLLRPGEAGNCMRALFLRVDFRNPSGATPHPLFN